MDAARRAQMNESIRSLQQIVSDEDSMTDVKNKWKLKYESELYHRDVDNSLHLLFPFGWLTRK
jgi:hypothetical protein